MNNFQQNLEEMTRNIQNANLNKENCKENDSAFRPESFEEATLIGKNLCVLLFQTLI